MRQSASEFLGKGGQRRVVGSLVAMLLAAGVLVVVFALYNARSQNRLAVEASTKLAETALDVKQREIARNLKDYSERADIRAHLSERVDLDWAAADGNLGPNIFASLGYEMAFVLTPDLTTRYAMIDGRHVAANAFGIIPNGLNELLRRAAAQTFPAVGMLRSGRTIWLVAAGAIHPGDAQPSGAQAPSPAMLLFAKRIDGRLLARIGSDYLLNRFRLVTDGDDDLGAALPLFSPSAKLIGKVTWIPERPGSQTLHALLPPMLASFGVFGVIGAFALRSSRRSHRELHAAARTIDSYADTLKRSEARFRDVAEASSDWIWESDSAMRLTFVSARFAQVTSLSEEAVLGTALDEFFQVGSTGGEWPRPDAADPAVASIRELRCTYTDAAGHRRIARLAARPVFDDGGAWTGYRGTATDITREVEAQEQAAHLSLHDPLTGLPNRAHFQTRLQEAFERDRLGQSRLAVLSIDLDHFKEVNDTLGHAAGDALLLEVAERLQACLGEGDTVARLGGDEFAVIQNGFNQPLDALALARRLIADLTAPYILEGRENLLGASVGIAFVEEGFETPSRVLKNADIALYSAKENGRGVARVFEAHMGMEREARRLLEQDLKQALAGSEFELHYQPLVALEDERIIGVEALVRWRHPSRGLVPPNDFIPLAEETGLILPIGEWVLRTACRQGMQWPGLTVAVNLSPVQFKHRDLVAMVGEILEETGLRPERLELEITEGVLMHDGAAARDTLTRLKALGVRIAMDDFGTGYSSLGYLNSFPFDKIKIDKSFISDLSAEKSNAIVRSVIGLGQSLDMVTIAEGVETAEQASFLRREGCQQVQGYHFGRPVPVAQLTELVATVVRPSAPAAA
ncbi:bifunctional diguanylate cyclase/phosphodiesterase [Aureimonas leprariae]|uniref:EAL domain-containing protein n=1 Tax=Plantimonas leprariae TaxID=2615207 RepID=A0A7V7PMU4_9HYPH|nr:EAL domain-containing protein [Aureimonas leprariae]KAB0678531.1 EAL domain-containing protein [Aureimonas leprariae]